MKILVIIPAYNEELNILNTCKQLNKANKKMKWKVDYLVINDGSKDRTSEVCKENQLPCINLVQNLGIGGAVQTGYKYAYENDYDIAIQFDGDGQHDAAYLSSLIEPIVNKEASMTIGSRYISTLSEFKSTKIRQFGIKILSFVLKVCTRKKVYDVTSGFRAINRDVIKLFKEDYPIDYPEPESLVNVVKHGYMIQEIPVKMNERKYGKSSITPFKSIYYMIKVSLSILINSIVIEKESENR